MSSAAKAFTASVTKLFTPAFYTAQYAELISYGRKTGKNSIKPFFAMMLGVGITGYTMEYVGVGAAHATHRREIVRKAMAADAGHH